MKRTGFTLIELLIVIGVVAILAAFLFPVFTQVREKGQQTVCLSNERQLGLAFLMYTHDNNDYYMPDEANVWAGQIFPYVKNVDVFHCPSDATSSTAPYYPVSYGMNADFWHMITTPTGGHKMVTDTTAEVSGKTVLLFEVVHSSAKIMTPLEGWSHTATPLTSSVEGNGGLLDYSWSYADNTNIKQINTSVRYATGVMSSQITWYLDVSASPAISLYEGEGRHQGGANFLYADAHVKWLRPQQVSTGADAVTPTDAPAIPGSTPTILTAAGAEDSHFAATFSTK